MRKLLTGAALAALLTSSALAADLTLKAPVAPGYPATSQSGWYAGLGADASVANSSVATAAFGTSLYSASASLVGVVGYQFKLGSNWAAIEAEVDYTNLGNNVICAPGVVCSVGSTWSFSQGAIFGFPWTQVFSYLPVFSSLFGTNPVVPLPSNVPTPVSSAPYIGGFIKETDVSAALGGMAGSAWQVQPQLGLGILSYLSGGVVADTRVKYGFANSSFSFGPGASAVANRGSSLETEIIFKF